MAASISVICFFVGVFIFMVLVSDAFKEGTVWGLLCLLFPPGTYVYCKKHWDTTKSSVLWGGCMLLTSLFFYIFSFFSN